MPDAKIFEGKCVVTCIYVKERMFSVPSGMTQVQQQHNTSGLSATTVRTTYMIEVHGCTWPHSISSEEIVSYFIAQSQPLLTANSPSVVKTLPNRFRELKGKTVAMYVSIALNVSHIY